MPDDIEVRQKIENIHDLPAMPSAVKHIEKLCQDPDLSINDISNFLSQEPILSARVLKAVNSAFYGFPHRISNIRHGLILLGVSFLKGLLISVSVGDVMERSVQGLWKHSAGTAAIARVIARRKRISDPEEVMVGSLLHDIGKMVLSLCFPCAYRDCLIQAKVQGTTLVKAEYDSLGVTHATAAWWVADKWGFPPVLLEQLGCHHNVDLAKSFPVQTAIVCLSDVLARKRSFGFGGNASVPELDPLVLQILGIEPKATQDILDEAENQLCKIEAFLEEG